MKKTWTVSLDPSNWAAFTYRRAADDELRPLGCIRRGPQMGALAVDARGRYVQVNGDFVTELNQSQVAAAVRRASAAAAHPAAPPGDNPDEPPLRATTKPPAKPPVIVVRRRRLLEIA